MTDNNEEAKELAHRAGAQAKHAGKNASRAVKVAAEPMAEAVAEEARETAEKLEGTVHDAVRTARSIRVVPGVLGRLTGDTGIGFLALSVSIYAGTIAFNQFRGVVTGRKAFLESAKKADHHIRPSQP